MSQPPYGPDADPYQNPQQAVGGTTPPPSVPGIPPQGSYEAPAQAGYGQPVQGGAAAPAGGGYGPPAPQGSPAVPAGDPGAQYGAPQAPKSKTGLIIAAVIAVLAIGGIILAVVLINRTPDPDPVVFDSDPVLNQIAQNCFDGSMAACDDLYLQSPVDSEYENYGNTCGGRIEEADVRQRLCVDIF